MFYSMTTRWQPTTVPVLEDPTRGLTQVDSHKLKNDKAMNFCLQKEIYDCTFNFHIIGFKPKLWWCKYHREVYSKKWWGICHSVTNFLRSILREIRRETFVHTEQFLRTRFLFTWPRLRSLRKRAGGCAIWQQRRNNQSAAVCSVAL